MEHDDDEDDDEDEEDDNLTAEEKAQKKKLKEKKKRSVAIPQDNSMNLVYTSTIFVGSNKQPIVAIFDTGSCNPWVLSQKAMDKANTSGKNVIKGFDPTKSKTFKDKQRVEKMKSQFGIGYILGGFARDTVTFGNPKDKNKNIELGNLLFAYGTESNDNYFQYGALIGLGYPQMCHPGVTPIFDLMI